MSAPAQTSSGAAAEARPLAHPGIALLVLVTCQLMVALDGNAMNIALPTIQQDLDFSPTNLAWVANAYTLTFGGLLLLGGRAGDILGRRRLFILGIVVFTLASLLGGVAQTDEWLLGARILQGLGAAFAAPGTLALIATNFAEGKARDRALGAVTAAYGLSVVLGMILGGVLTAWLGWRSVLFINVPIGAVLVVLTPRFVNESARHPGRFDLAGALTSTLGIAAVVYGFIHAASTSWTAGTTVVALVGGVVLLSAFVLIESRAEQPVLPLRLFRDRNRSGSYSNILLLSAPLVGASFLSTLFLQNVLGYGALRAGLAFLPMCAGLFIGGGVASGLLRRTGAKPLILFGTALIIIGSAWLTQLSVDSTYAAGILGPMVLLGMGPGFAFTALNQAILSGVPQSDAGAASGFLESMQWGGGALGLAVLVAVFGTASQSAAREPHPGLAPDLVQRIVLADGMATAFIAGAVLAAAGFIITVTVIRRRRAAAEPEAALPTVEPALP
ncbi:MFS transporter [Micromonospora sp. NPDC005215]|uniref:MFS transporter n=1 Tax=Micromonospora sp. NPDC005215 TaxID=3157024 RepID=UPI0033A33FE3